MSDLPAEWKTQPVHLPVDCRLQSVKLLNNEVVIYHKNRPGEWIQSDYSFLLTH